MNRPRSVFPIGSTAACTRIRPTSRTPNSTMRGNDWTRLSRTYGHNSTTDGTIVSMAIAFETVRVVHACTKSVAHPGPPSRRHEQQAGGEDCVGRPEERDAAPRITKRESGQAAQVIGKADDDWRPHRGRRKRGARISQFADRTDAQYLWPHDVLGG